VLKNAYEDPRFNAEVDAKTGYITRKERSDLSIWKK
jgi:hypothetical protein